MIDTVIEVLKDVSSRLESAGIAFMLTGSTAMNYYAQPRMTRDIDLIVKVAAVSKLMFWSLSLMTLGDFSDLDCESRRFDPFKVILGQGFKIGTAVP